MGAESYRGLPVRGDDMTRGEYVLINIQVTEEHRELIKEYVKTLPDESGVGSWFRHLAAEAIFGQGDNRFDEAVGKPGGHNPKPEE
jgi:hypothetical protein